MHLFDNVHSKGGPESLKALCFKVICKHPAEVFDTTEEGYELKEGVVLSNDLSQELLEAFLERNVYFDDKVAHLFANGNTNLSRVSIWESKITDKGLKYLIKHNLEELGLGYCRKLTQASLDVINEHGKNMKTLKIDYNVPLIDSSPASIFSKNFELKYYLEQGYVLNLPKLEHLTVKAVNIYPDTSFYRILLSNLHNLTYLDLSSSSIDNPAFNHLANLNKLTHLVLYDVHNVRLHLDVIGKLSNLTHLDISQTEEHFGIYPDEDATLHKLVSELPKLVYLDISGTNLSGNGVAQWINESIICDIAGLAVRAGNPLEYLGLYNTTHGACFRRNIPALTIAGEASEEQLLMASRRYIYRQNMMQKVMNDIFHLVRYATPRDVQAVLGSIVDTMNIHPYDKTIQTSGSAALFSIFKTRDFVGMYQKRYVLDVLLKSMVLHENDETMVRNSLLTLCQFKVPHDVIFIYDKLVSFLLILINNLKMEGFIHRIAMYLLNSLACQVDDSQKTVLGELHVIENMLTLIKTRIETRECDDILEIAWSTMWNVTDETPVNCARFLDGGGMDCFQQCLELFRNKSELMRNMMGLLGNVAEVEYLRSRLMTAVPIFYDLLSSEQDGIEVSYNAAGVLAHLASDGPEAWTEDCRLNREEVLTKMGNSIDSWELLSERNINYRSFKPILKLAACAHTPACRHWALWALANLTSVYPTKYCPILENEHGVDILLGIVEDSSVPMNRIKDLANVILINVKNYRIEMAIKLQ